MTNEYGQELDRNGYAPSIVPADGECFICKKTGNIYPRLQRHEIFHGSLYRGRSKALGLWVNLCPECHYLLHNREPWMDKMLKHVGQRQAMETYGWSIEDFRRHFGKNYLEAER